MQTISLIDIHTTTLGKYETLTFSKLLIRTHYHTNHTFYVKNQVKGWRKY